MRSSVVVAALVMAGCAGSNGGPAEASGGMKADVAATLEVKVSEPSVRLVLHVTNTGEDPLELSFATSQRYEFVVEEPSGEEVWRWSEGMAFLQALSEATLAPGESWDMEAVWDPGSRSGEYVARGMVTARGEAIEQTATFELP